MECLDCGNTEDFRVLYLDWSLVSKSEGSYGITDSLSFSEANDPNHPIECHNCDSTNVRIDEV